MKKKTLETTNVKNVKRKGKKNLNASLYTYINLINVQHCIHFHVTSTKERDNSSMRREQGVKEATLESHRKCCNSDASSMQRVTGT